jgi:hypothetical protein
MQASLANATSLSLAMHVKFTLIFLIHLVKITKFVER